MTSEKQLDAILKLGLENGEKMSEAIILEKNKDGNIKTDIKTELIKKTKTKYPYYVKVLLAIAVFIPSVYFEKDSLFISIPGLFAVLASNYLSTYRGYTFHLIGTITTKYKPTPVFLIEFVGWILLFIPIISEIIFKY